MLMLHRPLAAVQLSEGGAFHLRSLGHVLEDEDQQERSQQEQEANDQHSDLGGSRRIKQPSGQVWSDEAGSGADGVDPRTSEWSDHMPEALT